MKNIQLLRPFLFIFENFVAMLVLILMLIISLLFRREAAERASQALHNNLNVKGHYLRLLWGRPRATQSGESMPDSAAGALVPDMGALPVPNLPGLPGAIPVPGAVSSFAPALPQSNTVSLPPTTAIKSLLPPPPLLVPSPAPPRMGALYPSMDPMRMGSRSIPAAPSVRPVVPSNAQGPK